jgi:hypothetical protein
MYFACQQNCAFPTLRFTNIVHRYAKLHVYNSALSRPTSQIRRQLAIEFVIDLNEVPEVNVAKLLTAHLTEGHVNELLICSL